MKRKVAVIFGGYSSEYKISLQSAYSVISNMNRNKYELILVGITSNGDWYRFEGNIDKIISDTWFNDEECTPVAILPNRSEQGVLLVEQDKIRKIHVDVVFPVLHGRNGEDAAYSICGKFMYLVQMLMYGKEASNRKQEIDRQHHTIPIFHNMTFY